MKLKYLLPVATIASVAAITTPLVTSCAKDGIPSSWNFVTQGKYTAKVAPYKNESGTATEDEAVQLYYQELCKNPSMYNDDIFAYRSKILFDDDIAEIKKGFINANISNISLIDKEIPGESERKMINATISVSCDLNFKRDGGSTYIRDFDVTITNFKMFTDYGSGVELWFRPVVSKISSDLTKLAQFLGGDHEWSLVAKGNIDNEEFDYSFNYANVMDIASHTEDLRTILDICSSVSHYLSELHEPE